jgi:hypothetical protein
MLKLDRLENIYIDEIQMKARIGANIHSCLREALLVSITNQLPVDFVHNDKHYKVDADAYLDTLMGVQITSDNADVLRNGVTVDGR